MNSLMSMRIMCFSRCRTGNSPAPCTARSCPTPVGPRNRNEPVGRFGSDRPARAADRVGHRGRSPRLAGPTRARAPLPCAAACRARPASSWTPGCRWRHHLGDFSAPTLGTQQLGLAACGVLPASPLRLLRLLFQLRQLAVLQLGHLRKSPLRLSSSISADLPRLISSLTWALPCQLAFRPRFLRGRRTSRSSAISSFGVGPGASSARLSFFTASRSIFSWMMRRSRLSITSGGVDFHLDRERAASSIRSMALSGRKRSVM